MKKLLVTASLAILTLAACNQGGGSSTPVTTPNSNPTFIYQGPGADSRCLVRQGFHDRGDMCRQLRDGRVAVCGDQERYELFQNACQDMRWQDRDGDGQPVPGRRPPQGPPDRR